MQNMYSPQPWTPASLYLLPVNKGTVYKSPEEAEADWRKGVDFKTRKGKVLSIHDFLFLIDKYESIHLTYGKGNHQEVKIWP